MAHFPMTTMVVSWDVAKFCVPYYRINEFQWANEVCTLFPSKTWWFSVKMLNYIPMRDNKRISWEPWEHQERLWLVTYDQVSGSSRLPKICAIGSKHGILLTVLHAIVLPIHGLMTIPKYEKLTHMVWPWHISLFLKTIARENPK